MSRWVVRGSRPLCARFGRILQWVQIREVANGRDKAAPLHAHLLAPPSGRHLALMAGSAPTFLHEPLFA
jgi:hypothetical protein